MIARPLDLASRLQPPPRRFDYVFFIAIGFIFLQFAMFDSRFVISPGIPLRSGDDGVRIPANAVEGEGGRTTHRLGVTQTGLIYDTQGRISAAEIEDWLRDAVAQARSQNRTPSLLIQADVRVTTEEISRLYQLARRAGFTDVFQAVNRTGTGDL